MDIVRTIVELERLKERALQGSTHPAVFFQIKEVFHLLESLGSARIEGNRTTIDELVEAKVTGEIDSTEQLREISNIDDAMTWIEKEFEVDAYRRIDEAFISELHRLCVKNLRTPAHGGEGDLKPGKFRSHGVRILGAKHVPPSPFDIPDLIAQLVAFMNADPDPGYDLMRIAVAHHRFEFIHPFGNGNGRVGRLLTYAMLIRAGFRVHEGRILNLSAVFCADREAYMNALSQADSGQHDDVLAWCAYVLSGLKSEIVKIDRMLEVTVLTSVILQPALDLAKQRGNISLLEWQILSSMCRQQAVDAKHFQRFYPTRSRSSVSQVIARYKRHDLIKPYPEERSRTYVVNFIGKDLIRPLITKIEEAGFLPIRREP
jgi:Fic family protein